MRNFGKTIVNCKSEYEVNEFTSLMAKEGYYINNFKIGWEEHGKNVCFRFTLNCKNDIYYESRNYYEKYHDTYYDCYEFLTFQEFLEKFYPEINKNKRKEENTYSIDMLKFLELLDVNLLPWQKDMIQIYMDRETIDLENIYVHKGGRRNGKNITFKCIKEMLDYFFDKKETKTETKTETKYQIGDKVCIYDNSFSEFIIEGTVVNIYDNNRYGVRTSLFNELNCPECWIRNKKGEEEK